MASLLTKANGIKINFMVMEYFTMKIRFTSHKALTGDA